MLKQCLILTLFLTIDSFSYPSPSSESTKFQQEAHTWVSTYFRSYSTTITDYELGLIANLLYFSYCRSAATLQAQDVACKTLESVWQGWQNIAQTRMNPSLETPYQVDYAAQDKFFTDFLYVQQLHRQVGTTYANAAEITVKGNHSSSCHDAVFAIREQARQTIMKEFIEIKAVLGDLFDYVSNYARDIQLEQTAEYRFDFLDSIVSYIPSYFAMKGFVEAEKATTNASEKSWEVVNTVTFVSKRIWDAIEQARAAYYAAHYNALMQLIYENNLPTPQIMFDEYGFIPDNARNYMLPLKISY